MEELASDDISRASDSCNAQHVATVMTATNHIAAKSLRICSLGREYPYAIFLAFVLQRDHTLRTFINFQSECIGSELSMGPFCVTRSNATHQRADPTQSDPIQVRKFGPNPTQPNTTNSLTAWCNQILSNCAFDALT